MEAHDPDRRRDQPLGLQQTAAEPAEESLERERSAVGDQPDVGGLVDTGDRPDEDHAQ